MIKLLAPILLASCAFSIPAFSQSPPEINLCTGSEKGVYFSAGKMISDASDPHRIKVNVIETSGTWDNIQRVLAGQCHAMIGQPDGLVVLKRTAPADASRFATISTLHREYLHVLCNKDSGVDDFDELSSDPEKYSVAIGDINSGGWLIWQNIVAEDEKYGKITTLNDSGAIALTGVANGESTCMLIPSGAGHGLVREADEYFGDQIALIDATDKDFNDAKDTDGKPLYTFMKIPTDKYPKTYNKYWGGIKTISWNAKVYVNKQLLKGKDLEALIYGVTRARDRILQTHGK